MGRLRYWWWKIQCFFGFHVSMFVEEFPFDACARCAKIIRRKATDSKDQQTRETPTPNPTM